MIEIALQTLPNQSFTIQLENKLYDIAIKVVQNTMVVSLTRNNEIILSNMRVVAGQPVIPYKYLENGNFIFLTDDEELPFYTQFGISQRLLYVTIAELEGFRAST